MNLTLIPQFGADGGTKMTLQVAGDVITIDGTDYDLGTIPEGGEGWLGEGTPFIGPVSRLGGRVHATLIVRLGDDAAPAPGGPWHIGGAAGTVVIPAQRMADINDAAD